jgi:predicted AAA+ superfamily ATPase
MSFHRNQLETLITRLGEPRRFIQVLAGPRQVGKTTVAKAALAALARPARFATADDPGLRPAEWLKDVWSSARADARSAQGGAILVLDEIQKVPNWSTIVKALWDADSAAATPLHVVVLGSAPLLVGQGLTESLAGRFELIRCVHWSFSEMREAFGVSVEEFILFGGYPGAEALRRTPERWAAYIRDAIIEPTLARDILTMTRVDKPALFRQLFDLACVYASQIVTWEKLVGQLQDAGNTTTLAHYVELLAGAGMITGLKKFSGSEQRKRGSSPKLQVFNTALVTAQSRLPITAFRDDPIRWGRLVESAVGAHLVNVATGGSIDVTYWRERDDEVDFVIRTPTRTIAVEVKSSSRGATPAARLALQRRYAIDRFLVVGGDDMSVEDFLLCSPDSL